MIKVFAEDLKAIREEKNLSLRDISNKTRLNISILENLETGEYSFQPQAYIRAFLKQYLAAMDLDVEEVLFDYDLARSGKYKSKRQNISAPPPAPPKTEEVTASKNLTEKLKEIVESPKKKAEEKNSDRSLSEETKETIESKTVTSSKEISDKKPQSRTTINPNSESKTIATGTGSEKRTFSAAFHNSPVFRNILMILVALLVLLGVYSLINILFIEGGNSKPEVIRQNFDDVVKEQERKFLGKRTPEEIQDSIKKAQELSSVPTDSITLKIISNSPGVIFVVIDSSNYNRPDRVEYEKNETGTFKAGRSFHISSSNTETFKATLNNNPIKFGNKSVSKIKVTKDGIVN